MFEKGICLCKGEKDSVFSSESETLAAITLQTSLDKRPKRPRDLRPTSVAITVNLACGYTRSASKALPRGGFPSLQSCAE